ncbi:CPK2 [Symbiodinium pilosum]|uniref:CPK2 protein n=1 Tax=Symbiodinium pilosum TaxID=2952 RepID=A0A812WJU9_SYMPI|nr:CPK2 [Symbiodinium pilosum]
MTDLLKEYTFPETDAALGSGAFGTVMKVTHNGTGEVRAMKAVRLSDGAESAQLRELVELEVSMLKSLDHVNLLRLHEAFRDASCVYLVTELCAGGSLAERLAHQRTHLRKPMLEGLAAAYAEQILSAASYCHDRGVLHRDLKPENVLLLTARSDSPVKVIDFGLSDTVERIRLNCTQEVHDRSGALGAVARLLPKLPGGLEILATKETKEVMQRAGTPHYMAPEVYAGRYDDKADVWSIGVILFEMLSNRHPFYTEGNDLEAVKRRILTPAGADFCDPAWGEVSTPAQRACQECLQPDPKRRPSAKQTLAHKWFTTVPRLALGMSGGMDSGRSGFLASARSPPRISAGQVLDALQNFAFPGYVGTTRARLRQAFLRLVARELAEVQQEGLRGAFLRLDCDGDGALSAADLAAGLESTDTSSSHQSILSMLGFQTTNDNGQMEEIRSLVATAGTAGENMGFSDFLAVMLPYHVAVQEPQLRSAFGRLDSAKTGRLPKSTLQGALQVGQAVPQEEVAAFNAGLPQDLSYAEFRQLVGLHP